MEKTKHCHKCGTVWEGKGQPGTRAACAKCGEELHVCLNCRFYDTRRPNACMVPDTDPVLRKDSANYCEEFQFAERGKQGPVKADTKQARDAWDRLFKKK